MGQETAMIIQANYHREQATGARLLGWILDPLLACPISISAYTWGHIQNTGWDMNEQPGEPSPVYSGSNFLPVDLPGMQRSRTAANSYQSFAIFKYPPSQPFNSCRWIGRIAKGVIFLEDISRPEKLGYPFMSEMTKAIYERHFELDTLRYVVISHVANSVTRGFIIGVLQHSNNQNPQVWEADTPEFKILLGTPLGKVIAYFMLNAYPRGTRRIARIAL
ncbi:Uncharacterized protein PECH_007794 [Penicillium ucsense]|uniref:Uncharacterized protein n=1 Tax=Penicillium ucsense TaxID=2839758 RepID=A0A8J8W367_9EURO|nr:Uncharacterized protein PECM_007687 [Penicillium ucsense]KAF7734610.1 Uncharacterized protein PECH_007794 [Penicillium ucsense]